MRLKKKKILVSILIVVLLFSTIFSVRSIGGTLGEAITDILGTFVGILTWPVRIIALGIAYLMDRITSSIAYLDGGTSKPGKFFTPYEILFNKIRITDIDFFEFGTLSPDCATYKIRYAVAQWYYFTRMIAIAASLVVLAYVGVRMSLSTMAQDKAKYKKMLVDWASSVALIFLLHYIIIFILAVNTALVNAIGGSAGAKGDEISEQIGGIANAALGVSVYAIGATIVFTLLVKQTLGLLLAYINRMIKLAFLLIIAPLITITYSIDKMGDNKAQALNAWLKEFVYTILLQPFHCIIYMSLIDIAYGLIAESSVEDEGSLAACILAYLFIKFLTEAEKLVRKIFGFKDTDTGTTLGSGMAAAGATLALSKNIGSTVGKGVRFAKGALPGAMAAAGKAADKASNAIGAASTSLRAAGRAVRKKDLVDSELGVNSGKKAEGGLFARAKQQKAALEEARQKYRNSSATDKQRIKYQRKKVKKDQAEAKHNTNSKSDFAKARQDSVKRAKSDDFKKHQEAAEKTIKKRTDRKEKVKNSFVGKSFKTARGFVRKANGVASKMVNNEFTRMALKGGIATFAGSWSADKSMAAGITAGVAGWKVTDEALKYTGGQVKSDLNEKYAALGITSSEDAMKLYDDNDQHSFADQVKDGKAALREQGENDRNSGQGNLSESEVNRVLGEMSRQLATDASASLQSILNKALGDSQHKMSQAFEQKLRELYNNQKKANAVASMGNAFQLGFSERMVFGTADRESTHISSAFNPANPDEIDRRYVAGATDTGNEQPGPGDTGMPTPEEVNANMQQEIDDRVNQMMEDVTNSSTGVTEVVNRTVTEIRQTYDTSKPDKTIQELEGIISKLEGMEGDKAKELLAQVKIAKKDIEAEMKNKTGDNT